MLSCRLSAINCLCLSTSPSFYQFLIFSRPSVAVLSPSFSHSSLTFLSLSPGSRIGGFKLLLSFIIKTPLYSFCPCCLLTNTQRCANTHVGQHATRTRLANPCQDNNWRKEDEETGDTAEGETESSLLAEGEKKTFLSKRLMLRNQQSRRGEIRMAAR